MSKSPNSDDTHKDSKTIPSDSDNPFIRFRHFADEQVSSILQGFVGLPSAFSKPSSNSHWSIFDEELKRKDGLQTKRRALREAGEAEEARSGKRITLNDDEVQIPVKKSQRPHRSGVDFDQFISDRRVNVFGSYDIPLYSPLHSPLTSAFSGDLRHIMGSFAALTLYQANPSDVSLVPYLFGSPYSPLNLSLGQSMMRELGFTKTYSASGAISRDDFPYCEAFEDLLLTSQGRDAEVRTSGLKSTTIEASEDTGSSVENSLDWIERLRRLGILHLPNSDFEATSNMSRSSSREDVTSSQTLASSASRLKGRKRDAETEEQVYEKFLTDASTSPDQFFATLESTLTAVEKLMKGKNVTFEEPRQSNPSSVNEVDISEKQHTQSTESKREVSSSSTVEHYTNENGSVETTIRVWRRFADGSETETSSSHTVEKATRQRDLARTDFDPERFLPSQGANDGQKHESRTKKNIKSGWFWN